jgi:hypothetical protein
MKLLQKRPDIFFIALLSYYIYSSHGHKPQVAALFKALKYIIMIYLIKNSLFPSKSFYFNWVKTLKEFDFETSPGTLRVVVSFLAFAMVVYQFVESIYTMSLKA